MKRNLRFNWFEHRQCRCISMPPKRKRPAARTTDQREELSSSCDSVEPCQVDSMDECERSTSEADASMDSGTRNKSNVWLYAHRHPTSDGWAICDLCPLLPAPKRISTKGGTTTTLRKHLVKVHNKVELQLARPDRPPPDKISSVHRARLHQLLINAIVVDGRCFGDFRRAGFSRFLECAIPGEFCFTDELTSMHSLSRICFTASEHGPSFTEASVYSSSWSSNRATAWRRMDVHYLWFLVQPSRSIVPCVDRSLPISDLSTEQCHTRFRPFRTTSSCRKHRQHNPLEIREAWYFERCVIGDLRRRIEYEEGVRQVHKHRSHLMSCTPSALDRHQCSRFLAETTWRGTRRRNHWQRIWPWCFRQRRCIGRRRIDRWSWRRSCCQWRCRRGWWSRNGE